MAVHPERVRAGLARLVQSIGPLGISGQTSLMLSRQAAAISASLGSPASRTRQRPSARSSAARLAGLSPHPGPTPGSMPALIAASASVARRSRAGRRVRGRPARPGR